MKTLTIASSHGFLTCDETGRVLQFNKTCEKDCARCIATICKVDVKEYEKQYGNVPTHHDIDILDIGYWTATGEYTGPEKNWRKVYRRSPNGYKNLFGVHTPENSLEYFDSLVNYAPDFDWADTSWHNDSCDSASFDIGELQYRVWFPNPKQDCLGFVASVSDENGEDLLQMLATDIEEAVNLLKGFLEKKAVTSGD